MNTTYGAGTPFRFDVILNIFKSSFFVIVIASLFMMAVTLTSQYFLGVYDVNAAMRAAIPSKGLFQLSNILFWGVIFFGFHS